MVDQFNRGLENAVASVAGVALEAMAALGNLFTGVGDVTTAFGLDPNAQGGVERGVAALSAATLLIPMPDADAGCVTRSRRLCKSSDLRLIHPLL